MYGALASHYKLARSRPQGTAAGARLHPHPRRARLVGRRAHGRGGRRRRHAVPRRLADHGALAPAARRPRRGPPAASTSCATSPASCSGARRSTTARASRRTASVRESWMHVEIDRLGEDDDPAAIVEDIQRVLRDVREAVEDWAKMHAAGRRDRRRAARATRRRLDRGGDAAGAELLRVARRRPLHLPRLPRVPPRAPEGDGRGACCAPCRAAASGILRADQDMSESFGRLPDAGQGEGPRARPCWCWPRPTPAPRCTARRTSTTSA